MKQPKLNDLRIDRSGTKKMRNQMARAKKVKITINIDSDVLLVVKELAEQKGTPYQTLLNRLLKEALQNKQEEQSRLDRLEKEIKKLKKNLAA